MTLPYTTGSNTCYKKWCIFYCKFMFIIQKKTCTEIWQNFPRIIYWCKIPSQFDTRQKKKNAIKTCVQSIIPHLTCSPSYDMEVERECVCVRGCACECLLDWRGGGGVEWCGGFFGLTGGVSAGDLNRPRLPRGKSPINCTLPPKPSLV